MRWRSHLCLAVIEQILDVDSLSELSEMAAIEADESGYLAGNQMYQDLRGYGWLDVARTLEVERRLERSAFRLTHILSSSDSWRILVVEWP
jgi:hypothetical protein